VDVRKILLEGYQKVRILFLRRRIFSEHRWHAKFPSSFFKIQLHPYGDVTILSSRKLVNELRNAPDDALDFTGGAGRVSLTIGGDARYANEKTQTILPDYTVSPIFSTHRFHVPTIRTTLTRNLGILFEDIVDEMKASFEDNVGLSETSKYTRWYFSARHVHRQLCRMEVRAGIFDNDEYCL
jgi:hypothetical protein